LVGYLVCARNYSRAFGRVADASDQEALLVDVDKALAALQETIVSGRTPFDDFRDALARGDPGAAATFPEAAQRGAILFVGRGKCHICHGGPAFSNGEFADVGVSYFVAPARVDPGRHGGIAKLRRNQFNLTGRDRNFLALGP
jgi:cytochrome c peroxidase